MAFRIGAPTFMGIWERMVAGMVQTHQSAMRGLRRPAFLGIHIGGGDALGVLLDVGDLAIVFDHAVQRAAEGLADHAHAAHRLEQLASGNS